MRARFLKKCFLCAVIAFVFCITYLSSETVLASCEDYLKEAEAVEGVVPRFNDDGTIRAFVIFGEGTFLTS